MSCTRIYLSSIERLIYPPSNAIYGPQPASTSVQKLRTPQVENGYHTENENKVLQKHQRRRTSSFSAQPIPYKRPYNPNEILFYDQAKKYYEFTNFSPHPIRYNMKDYPSSEHLFQSLKVCPFYTFQKKLKNDFSLITYHSLWIQKTPNLSGCNQILAPLLMRPTVCAAEFVRIGLAGR